jgi:RES domain-containing protein
MTHVYRLVRAERAAEALPGEGARLYGGRWNPRGVAAVYASATRAVAVLETFVHVPFEARAMRFMLITLALPARARVERYARRRAPATVAESQEVGRGRFVGARAPLALVVPSVIVPQESNYVLCPRHARFVDVRVVAREAFSFDERLWQRAGRSELA